MLMNSNLFFYLIIPVLSTITFVLSYKYSFYGLVGTIIYQVYYLTNVLIHMENGKVSPIYDFYWFVQNGLWTSAIVVPMILIITYGLFLLLWFGNSKFHR